VQNRIREHRERAGLTGEQLAKRVGTSYAQLYRLERGDRPLSTKWMEKFARALGVQPTDLIANLDAGATTDDVTDATVEPPIAAALAAKGMRAHKVLADSVVGAGIEPGNIVVVDWSQAATGAVDTGDIVLVQLKRPPILALRAVFLLGWMKMLLTLRPGRNTVIAWDDPTVDPNVVGVVVRERATPRNGAA
jgi:transcriptional regulator with XRE-family HTH domain